MSASLDDPERLLTRDLIEKANIPDNQAVCQFRALIAAAQRNLEHGRKRPFSGGRRQSTQELDIPLHHWSPKLAVHSC
jgi:hypothetical protein